LEKRAVVSGRLQTPFRQVALDVAARKTEPLAEDRAAGELIGGQIGQPRFQVTSGDRRAPAGGLGRTKPKPRDQGDQTKGTPTAHTFPQPQTIAPPPADPLARMLDFR
jgi:hypothetical protein